jgi:hypothetical protein
MSTHAETRGFHVGHAFQPDLLKDAPNRPEIARTNPNSAGEIARTNPNPLLTSPRRPPEGHDRYIPRTLQRSRRAALEIKTLRSVIRVAPVARHASSNCLTYFQAVVRMN